MSESVAYHRRTTDGRVPWPVIAERILLWAAVLSVLGAGAIKYARLAATADKADSTERRVSDLEKVQGVSDARSDEKWKAVIDRLDRIERKIDRRLN